MRTEQYLVIKAELAQCGHGDEYDWAQAVTLPETELDFASATIWVICNSGMKYAIAKQIYDRCCTEIRENRPLSFKNRNKRRAILAALHERVARYDCLVYHWGNVDNALTWMQTLDGIGPVTRYHLARNCGFDVVKPDRHLVRIAEEYGETPAELCGRLAKATGDRVGAVDVVLWRAAIEGLL